MPITLNTPIVRDNVEYPYIAVQMIINPIFSNGAYVNSSIFNFKPFRVVNGKVDQLMEDPSQQPAVPSLLLADANVHAATDPVLAQSMGLIMQALQNYVTHRNIG